MEETEMITELLERSRAAQKVLETYDQAKIDSIVRMFAKIVYDNAEELGTLAHDESRMGILKDKIAKCQGKARILWNDMKGKKSVGVIADNPDTGITEIAKPMGVIACVTPCTNPVVTPMCNAMFAVKCANTAIIAPHPRGKKCAARLAEMYHSELKKMGVPEDIFLVIEEPTVDLTGELMRRCDVTIATGGTGMVKAAYSSGHPAFGVGPGNVQGIFDRNIDLETEVAKAINSRIYDNGIICSGEQSIIAPKDDYEKVIEIARKNGAYYIDDEETMAKIREAVFPNGVISRTIVGQGPEKILAAAGIDAPEGTRVVIVHPSHAGEGEFLNKEKMCPMMCAFSYDTWENAVDIAYQNLCYEGKGHSASIHSNDNNHIAYAGQKLPVSRALVNQLSSGMAGGSLQNGLNPTTTLGCGSWGNNSISENLSWFHLMNKTRISRMKKSTPPTDEEIWSE